MSYPYKIRKVAWGSCKPNNESDTASTTITNNFDPTQHLLGGNNSNDPHTIGGNLQRAILFDLIELRHRYYTELKSSSTTNNNKDIKHATTGISFGQFKKCFQEARFGAIHTRTIPARVDRGEYVQLLYSSCFYLLEQAFDTHNNQSQVEVEVGENSTNYTLNWSDDEHITNSAFNAIYAVFILYTLHKTNILPKPPNQTSISSASNKYNNEQSLQNCWSMLPIGINNNDEDKLYRRTFHGKVRIDRYNFMLLLQLREICLVRMEQCDIGKMNTNSSTSSKSGDTTTASWKCNCSLARDAVYILDSMLSSNDDNDDFFEYCEYHGPHSLEGLAGSPNFYRAYFSNNQKSTRSSNVVSTTATTTITHAVCNESELNEMINKNDNDDTLDFQSLSQLVKGHQTNLATVMSQLHKSRLTKDDELQPKQRELVENTLKEINISNEPLKLFANDTSTTNDKAKSPESPIALPETKQESTTKHVSILQFPERFSTTLCNEIKCSLVDFRNEIVMIRKDVIKNKRKDEVRMNQQVVIDYGDDFTSIAESEPVKRRPNDDDEEASGLGRKCQHHGDISNHDEFDLEEEEDVVTERDDDLSVATGGGRNALYSLLSMVGGNAGGCGSDVSNYDEDDSIATTENDHMEDKTVPPSNSKSHQPMALNDDDDDDNASVVSGMGTRALQFLLSHQSSRKQSKKHPKKKRTKIGRKAPPSEDKNAEDGNESIVGEDASDSDEDISVAAGTNALATLLAHV